MGRRGANDTALQRSERIMILGLDLSLTSSGWATDDGEGNIFTQPSDFDHPQARYEHILSVIINQLARSHVAAGMIEGYGFAKRSPHAHAQGELGGIVRHGLWKRNVPYIEVPPTSLKKFTTGKGNATKSDMISSVTLRTGKEWSGKGADDRVDAWALRQMALAALGAPEYDWPKTNLEALNKVDWSAVT